MNLQEWIEQKYLDWERAQGARQSYYYFARYLDVSHTALAQWMNGVNQPAGDDLANIAGKLGSEIYTVLGIRPSSVPFQAVAEAYLSLPAALRTRLDSAITEAGQSISQRKLSPESNEAKRITLKIFDKWGFRITD